MNESDVILAPALFKELTEDALRWRALRRRMGKQVPDSGYVWWSHPHLAGNTPEEIVDKWVREDEGKNRG